MEDMNPCQVTPAEWQELTTVRTICNAWGIESNTTPDEFSPLAYAVKFKFASVSPGYIGDLFILQGDVLTVEGPMVLPRGYNGELVAF
jgi:hypothetical protein